MPIFGEVSNQPMSKIYPEICDHSTFSCQNSFICQIHKIIKHKNSDKKNRIGKKRSNDKRSMSKQTDEMNNGVKHWSHLRVAMANLAVRRISFTASRDWLYRYNFSYSGLESVLTDIANGTSMHCWVPKTPRECKPNLLLLHGFGANAMWQYADTLHHFIPKFNVYVPDLLFFGRSYSSEKDRKESFQAKCLMKLMHFHGVRKLSIVGISYGGFVGYSMASQFPEAIDKSVFCCSGVSLEEKDMEDGLFKVRDLKEAAQLLVPQTPNKLRELMKLTFAKPPKGIPDWILADFINVMCKECVEEKTELIQEILKDRHFCDLPKIYSPTLIIWGEQDQVFPLELGYRLQRHNEENAKIVVIKNAGHAVNLEKSREFNKHLKSFLIGPNNNIKTPRSPEPPTFPTI